MATGCVSQITPVILKTEGLTAGAELRGADRCSVSVHPRLVCSRRQVTVLHHDCSSRKVSLMSSELLSCEGCVAFISPGVELIKSVTDTWWWVSLYYAFGMSLHHLCLHLHHISLQSINALPWHVTAKYIHFLFCTIANKNVF